ncbi:hypothetical protein [Hydrogenophaga sp.]|uniref:hypothetical protein n=1 Tax=Hydrogenophaga sp. TaxID=1904254 RepID=UPI0027158E8C|nr:hypothetical protein [Hydrogenophaga sp.]MDO9434067.1 hypothetical protein [Hydrogenophaga sp.]
MTPQSAKAMRQQAVKDLKDPKVLQARAKQRDELFAALTTYSTTRVSEAMKDLPANVTLASYFPIANPENFRAELSKSALNYGKIFNKSDSLEDYISWHGKVQVEISKSVGLSANLLNDQSLVDYIKWYEIYHHLTLRNDATLALSPDLMGGIKPDVVELCTALRAVHESDDKATMKKSASTIRKVLHGRSINARALAEQPIASTRMMLQKCTLLKKYMGILDTKAFAAFQVLLEEAHQWRKTAHVSLQTALLRTSVHAPDVVQLAVIAHARAATIPTAGYVNADATPAQLKAMAATLNAVIRLPDNTRTALQTAALLDIQASVLAMSDRPRSPNT